MLACQGPNWPRALRIVLGRSCCRGWIGTLRHFSWQAPKVDCYALLGVSESASLEDIRKSYLQRAKNSHPDVAGSGNEMVQLNLCYEALTQKRKEYDAAKGVAGKRTTSSFGTNTREAWWRAQGGFDDFQDDYYPFHFEEFAERRWRPKKQAPEREPREQRRPTWEEFAEMWDENEFQAQDVRGRRNRKRYRRGKYAMYEESSDEDEWTPPPRARGRKQRESFHQEAPNASSEEVPEEMWVEISGRNSHWASIGGSFAKLEKAFNGRPAFERMGEPSLFMFWSQQFGDWKIAERLQDDGACVGFAEDMKGRRRPWLQHPTLRWRLWDPTARRFVPRRLNIDACADEPPGSEQTEAEDDDGSVPWSRPHWSQWSTTDLIRWCDRRRIDLSGCFDREAVLDRVIQIAKEEMAEAENESRRPLNLCLAPCFWVSLSLSLLFSLFLGVCLKEEQDGTSHFSPALLSLTTGASGTFFGTVRVASRVKTDGSYTRPPTLDRRNSTYGNRVERFNGVESDVLPWLYSTGDKSRLYGVYFGNEFAYSLVWTRQKFWGRPGSRLNRFDEW
ncbi:unnamed protein product [Durusdinium trenchii]|uniref:J domain-containing protein n=1 Tax=Durusdinium trenchii TaxID=1381693 RepID=A0ABP0NEZ8_9DINO